MESTHVTVNDESNGQTVQIEVTMQLVVESELDPRDERGGVPYEFAHLQPTPQVSEFLEHLEQKVAERFAVTGARPVIVEFEVLDDAGGSSPETRAQRSEGAASTYDPSQS